MKKKKKKKGEENYCEKREIFRRRLTVTWSL